MNKTLATFTVTACQYLDPQGNITQPLPAFANEPDTLLALYRIMVLTRMYDEKAVALQRTGKIGTYAQSYGEEAISVAMGYAMQEDDVFVPAYRNYATHLQRTTTMSDLLRFWGGDERGSAYCDKNNLPMCVPIATQCLHAAGIAKAIQLRQENRVVVATCGDGGTSEGDFYEALNIAGVWHLPLVFVISNNQWAISLPVKEQTSCLTLAQKAFAGGFKGIQVDGNDVIAMLDQCQEAIDKARSGHGPTLIEAVTYRLGNHTTADDAKRYAPESQLADAKKRDPIDRLYLYLCREGHWDEEKEHSLRQSCRDTIDKAVADFEQTPPQSLNSLFQYHYANMPIDLQQQYLELIEDESYA